MVWDNMNVMRGHDEYYDVNDLHKAFEDGRKEGWREAMEEAQRSGFGERGGYGQRDMNYDSHEMSYGQRDGGYSQREKYPHHSGFNPDAYGERRGVKGTGPYSRMR